MIGVALFSVASLVCGLAGSIGVLIAARAVQGLGAAIISPATLSIITTTFEEGAERNKALGIWGAMGGSGAAAGVLFGGILTKYLGWEWIFFVNVPVGVARARCSRARVVRESRIAGLQGFDVGGAVTVTGEPRAARLRGLEGARRRLGERAHDRRARSRRAVLLARVRRDRAARRGAARPVPDLPREDRRRARTSAGVLLGAVVFANFFLLTLYVQQVLGYSALKTGLTFLATAGTVDPRRRRSSQALTTRFGPRPVLAVGLALMTGGDALVHADPGRTAASWRDLLPGYLLVGVGMAFAFIPMSIAALAGVGAARGGARVRADQHVAADRRRARRRDRLDRSRFTHATDAARRPATSQASRADERLRARASGCSPASALRRVVAALVLVRRHALEAVEAEARRRLADSRLPRRWPREYPTDPRPRRRHADRPARHAVAARAARGSSRSSST